MKQEDDEISGHSKMYEENFLRRFARKIRRKEIMLYTKRE